MTRRRFVVVAVLLLLAAGAWLLLAPAPTTPDGDPVAANDVRARTEASWGDLDLADYPPGPDFTVLDDDGTVLLARGEPVADELDAVRARASSLGVVVDGRRVGTVLVRDAEADALADAARADRVRAGVLVLAAAALVMLVWVSVERGVLRPFARLRRHATAVAAGDLDVPLAMDRGRPFGEFTESFDLLRTELARARAAEAEAVAARHELVAELSHDLRTPIASIVATTELLALRTDDPAVRERLDVVLAKAAQIGELADDLTAAGADAATDLAVEPRTLTPDDLTALVRGADTAGLVTEASVPEVLVRADPRRLAQVLDNVLLNAAKYARGPVTVTGRVDADGITAAGGDAAGDVDGEATADTVTLTVTDSGPGLPAEELTAVLGRGVRGTGSAGIPGQGLGLYTAARLMERMGGHLELRGTTAGLAVDLTLPLDR
ncbi:HAMP domain-containing sensor histidine kinase [Georgenia sp. Z1344]|uniref:HAMP domain-containing sensor histidine kinase n=1 Tax=Georgenia sp. Z1344 TaxID=3416706 RepID=UPI003CF5C22B